MSRTIETWRCSVKKRAVLCVFSMYSASDLWLIVVVHSGNDANLIAALDQVDACGDDSVSKGKAAFCGNHVPVGIAQLDRTQSRCLKISTALCNHDCKVIRATRIPYDR